MKALRYLSVRNARPLHKIYGVLSRIAPSILIPVAGIVGKKRFERLLLAIERPIKMGMFDCHMCGQCVLSSTGMACPMNCAKQLRNGPCGGVREDGGCEVKPDMRCVWLDAEDGRARIGPEGVPIRPLNPLDQTKAGESSWIQVIYNKPPSTAQSTGAREVIDHPAASFERACHSGRLIVTVEVAPPDSADPNALLERAQRFDGLVDAINITDGAGGHCHMSSVAASALLAERGMTPIYQVACRDRNRIAIQGDILGAAALGVRNILCLTGDDVSQGDQPEAKRVFDLDVINLIRIAREMRDYGVFASGRKIASAPNVFIGATANPFVPPYTERVVNLEQKVKAGAKYIQTQFCFEPKRLSIFMEKVRLREIHREAKIIVGVGVLPTAKGLAWMAKNVPGVHVPDKLIKRIAAANDQAAEGVRACVEIIHEVAGMDGIAGIHLMGHKNEDTLAQIIVEAGLAIKPRRLEATYGGVRA